ncbi:MAG TPA: hypothetical protein VE863_07465 [Pyrinomonadaceae bacterium]|jgi:uncharacterized membrane protein|nr:hypothetical protein [Pyrinomonadaceae bacterium]
MRKSVLTIPEIGLIGMTRVALGAGLALLLGDKLDRQKRRAVGWSLFLVGVLTTAPLVLDVLSKKPDASQH